MEGKSSVIIYADWIATVSRMPIEDRGYLLTLILEYINDKEPDEEKYGLLVSVAFGGIKQQMKRDLVKWKKTVEQRSGAGKASAEAKRKKKEENEIQRDSTPVDFVQQTSTNSTVTVNDNVNEKEGKGNPSELEVIEYFEKNGYTQEHAKTVFEYYDGLGWTDKNKIPIENWKYHLRKQWMKEDGRFPLTREEVIQINNNPPVSQENWNRMSKSQQHNYNVMHGGSGFPLKDK